MNIDYMKELFKLVSSLDRDWNGNDRSKTNLISFITKNQDFIADSYVEEAYYFIAEYDEERLHLFRHQLINEILVDENKEKRKYFVYRHAVPNGKIYIGITCCKDVESRWDSGFGYSKNQLFCQDIEKYGWDNITHEILYKNLSPEEAKTTEIELIKQHNSTNPQYGYNVDDGGKIATTPYIWSTWMYDIKYQFGAKRRPFKVIVDKKDLIKFKKHISKFNGEIIECNPLKNSVNHFFVVATNPSYKELQVRNEINAFLQNSGLNIQVEYLYGAIEGKPFEFDKHKRKLIVRFYVIDNQNYKLESMLRDLIGLIKTIE